jgi:hypothetical protein
MTDSSLALAQFILHPENYDPVYVAARAALQEYAEASDSYEAHDPADVAHWQAIKMAIIAVPEVYAALRDPFDSAAAVTIAEAAKKLIRGEFNAS